MPCPFHVLGELGGTWNFVNAGMFRLWNENLKVLVFYVLFFSSYILRVVILIFIFTIL